MTSQAVEPFRKNGLILRRMIRHDETKWQNARSWLGGRPKIDPTKWPRSEHNNLPLHHLAQLDFADIPDGPWSAHLPNSGALSFFMDTDIEDSDLACAVIHTPNPTVIDLASPPADCQPIGGGLWFYESLHRSTPHEKEARRSMIRWPVDFLVANFRTDACLPSEIIQPSLDDLLGPPVPNIHIFPAPQYEDKEGYIGPIDQGIFPWDVARRILKQAGKIAPETSFVQSWQALIQKQDLYAPMGAETVEKLEQEVKHFEQDTGERVEYGSGTTTVRSAASEAYREMMVGPRKGYDSIPKKIRDYLETKRIRSGWSSDSCHQVFGVGRDVQDQIEARSDQILLFQADTDDMMFWMWGDIGVIQFWITFQDLVNQNWGAIECTFEGG